MTDRYNPRTGKDDPEVFTISNSGDSADTAKVADGAVSVAIANADGQRASVTTDSRPRLLTHTPDALELLTEVLAELQAIRAVLAAGLGVSANNLLT